MDRDHFTCRCLAADVVTAPQYANDSLQAALPLLLGAELRPRARERLGK